MKKALIILLTISLLFVAFLFTFGRFDERKNGIITEYYYWLDIDDVTDLEQVVVDNNKFWDFKVNGISCSLRIVDFNTGESYLQTYPYSSEPHSITEVVGRTNGILCYTSYRWGSDLTTFILEGISFKFDSQFIVSILNTTSKMFTSGIGEFSIYDSFDDNLFTWVADFVVEFVHFVRVNITFMGGNLFI